MPTQTEPLSGLAYDWPLGYPQAQQAAGNWKDVMDANLVAIGQQAMPVYVLSRAATAPPGSPAAGDVYIPAATATGAWEGHEDELAVWDGSAWQFVEARPGRTVVIEDEGILTAMMSDGWAEGAVIASSE